MVDEKQTHKSVTIHQITKQLTKIKSFKQEGPSHYQLQMEH